MNADFSFTAPHLDYRGTVFGITLRHAGEVDFDIDVASFNPTPEENYPAIDFNTDLSFSIHCMDVFGARCGFTLAPDNFPLT